eukprot:TRINITY_DN6189_c0_g2_i1.p1 TRINITY_DN6189_c0_g2~~TRINITY_DN6189_c0_g2_i1.p1  ORF type:complete len:133 (-),score=19.55 TRINITY_DN6189_c0_g2_i1:108-506(-)
MGAAVCCAEDKSCYAVEDAVDPEKKTTVGMPLTLGDISAEAVSSELVMQLQGHWYRRSRGEVVGEIIDSTLLWDSIDEETTVTSPLFQVSHSKIMMIMTDSKTNEQQSYVADVNLEAQATISWEDGDVWIRK